MEHRLVVCALSGVPTPLKQKSGHNVRLAHRQNARVPNSGEGGKKVSPKDLRAASQEPEYSNRSASFASVTLNPDFNFLGSVFAVTRFGIRPSGSDREKTSSQKEE